MNFPFINYSLCEGIHWETFRIVIIGIVQTNIHDCLALCFIHIVKPSNVDVVKRVGEYFWHVRIRTKWSVFIDIVKTFNIRNDGIGNLFDTIRWESIRGSVPSGSTTKPQFHVVYFVVDSYIKTICSAIHPRNVSVS